MKKQYSKPVVKRHGRLKDISTGVSSSLFNGNNVH